MARSEVSWDGSPEASAVIWMQVDYDLYKNYQFVFSNKQLSYIYKSYVEDSHMKLTGNLWPGKNTLKTSIIQVIMIEQLFDATD